jgi:hypothetical protein
VWNRSVRIFQQSFEGMAPPTPRIEAPAQTQDVTSRMALATSSLQVTQRTAYVNVKKMLKKLHQLFNFDLPQAVIE